MTITVSKLFDVYEQTANFVRSNPIEESNFSKIEMMFEEKRRKADAHIIVYGNYNAGKSTLINALLGEEVAPTGDIPVTSTVTAYRWKQYEILDTPGVDAPIEHQQITDAEMLKADAVIFVVNPRGEIEEQATLDKLLNLVRERKQVFLVFNEKHPLNDGDFLKLKTQIQERLQELAAQKGLKHVLKDIPIMRINAKFALEAKMTNRNKLLIGSRFIPFEKELTEFLSTLSQDEIYNRLKNELSNFLRESLNLLKNRSQAGLIKKYDDILNNTETSKVTVRQTVRKAISQQRTRIHSEFGDTLKAALHKGATVTEAQLNPIFESSAQSIMEALSSEIKLLNNQLEVDLDNLQTLSSEIKLLNNQLEVDLDNLQTLSKETFSQVEQNLGQLALSEQPSALVQVMKNNLPAITDILIKTLGTRIPSIIIPYIGPVLQAVFSLFSGDSAAEQQLRQEEQRQRQLERAMQEIEDNARQIASDFEDKMISETDQNCDEFFAKIKEQIDTLSQGFKKEDRVNSERIVQLSHYLALIETA